MSIHNKWLQDVPQKDPEAVQRRVDLVTGSHALLGILTKIIEREVESLNRSAVEGYDNPNWALKEADRRGSIRAYQHLLEMTKLRNVNV